jgi:hypothetical protein
MRRNSHPSEPATAIWHSVWRSTNLIRRSSVPASLIFSGNIDERFFEIRAPAGLKRLTAREQTDQTDRSRNRCWPRSVEIVHQQISRHHALLNDVAAELAEKVSALSGKSIVDPQTDTQDSSCFFVKR